MHPFTRPAGRHRRVRPADRSRGPRPAPAGRPRRAPALLAATVITLLTAGGLAAAGGAATAAPVPGGPALSSTATAPPPTPPPTPAPSRPLDGFRITWTPPGVGSQVTDFAYEWEDVRFASRVWESGSDADGYQVDLDVHVLRGASLTGGGALRGYLAGYLEKGDDWPLDPVRIGDRRGYLSDDGDVFWLVRPGTAVWVTVDQDRFGRDALLRTAQGVREVRTPTTSPDRTPGPVRALGTAPPTWRAGQRTSSSAS